MFLLKASLALILGLIFFKEAHADQPRAYLNENGQSLYDVLGVSKEASFDEIKKSYRQIMMKNHPDRGMQGDFDLAKRAAVAWGVLRDRSKRSQYDLLDAEVRGVGGRGGFYDPRDRNASGRETRQEAVFKTLRDLEAELVRAPNADLQRMRDLGKRRLESNSDSFPKGELQSIDLYELMLEALGEGAWPWGARIAAVLGGTSILRDLTIREDFEGKEAAMVLATLQNELKKAYQSPRASPERKNQLRLIWNELYVSFETGLPIELPEATDCESELKVPGSISTRARLVSADRFK